MVKRIFYVLFVLAALVGAAEARRLFLGTQRVAATGGAAYDPATDSAAVRWYRAEGTVGTNVNNFAVTNLIERKSVGYPFTNLTALADGPILTNNFVNGKAAMGFYATNALLSALGSIDLGASDGHIFIVLKAAFDDGAHSLTFWKGFGADTTGDYYPFTDNNVYNAFGSTTRHNGDPATSLDAWRLLEIVSVAGEWTLYLDGSQQFTDASNTVGWHNSQLCHLGAASFPPAGQWQGWIAEIVIRNARATGGTLTDIRTYFDTQYNLSY